MVSDARERRGELERLGHPERVGAAEEEEAGVPVDEGDRDDERQPDQHLAREDVERVLRDRGAAVGEGVGELRGVGGPELDAREADEEPEEDQPAADEHRHGHQDACRGPVDVGARPPEHDGGLGQPARAGAA